MTSTLAFYIGGIFHMPVYFLNWPERVHRVILPRKWGNLEKNVNFQGKFECLYILLFYCHCAPVYFYMYSNNYSHRGKNVK